MASLDRYIYTANQDYSPMEVTGTPVLSNVSPSLRKLLLAAGVSSAMLAVLSTARAINSLRIAAFSSSQASDSVERVWVFEGLFLLVSVVNGTIIAVALYFWYRSTRTAIAAVGLPVVENSVADGLEGFLADITHLENPSEDQQLSVLSGLPETVLAPRSLRYLVDEWQMRFIAEGKESDLDQVAANYIMSTTRHEAFYVVDLACVYRRWSTWTQMMPRVKPFYAVKCNPNPAIVNLLSALGTGFDCASDKEIEQVIGAGADPFSRIVYAHPVKMLSHLKYAKSVSASLTTFDTVSELHKMAKYWPEARLVLRIRADDPDARCVLGNKYGAEVENHMELLTTAKDLGLNVVGISFHVGSGATNPSAFSIGIALARETFNKAISVGFKPTLLDIGGGFSSSFDMNGLGLAPVAQAVNAALAEHFPNPEITVIAEPGRFMVESCATLYANVFGSRESARAGGFKGMDYWISDGVYGNMNCLMYDHAEVRPRILSVGDVERDTTEYPSTVFGPTCDGIDIVMRDVKLPKLDVGDWITFPCMGAYTMACGSNFNGFNILHMKKHFLFSKIPESLQGKPVAVRDQHLFGYLGS